MIVESVHCQVCSSPRELFDHTTCGTCDECGQTVCDCVNDTICTNCGLALIDMDPNRECSCEDDSWSDGFVMTEEELAAWMKDAIRFRHEHAFDGGACPFQCRAHLDNGYIDKDGFFFKFDSKKEEGMGKHTKHKDNVTAITVPLPAGVKPLPVDNGWRKEHGDGKNLGGTPQGVCQFGCLEHWYSQFKDYAGRVRSYADSATTPAGSKGGSASNYGGYGSYLKKDCTHAMQQFAIGDKTIYVTASRDSDKAKQGPHLGVYLDSGWRSKIEKPTFKKPVVAALGGLTFDISDISDSSTPDVSWPSLIVGWPDRGVIHLEVARRLCDFIWEHMQEGKMVETGCFGAHGRTGTLLAFMLIRFEKLDARKAVTEVRSRLCEECIESTEQVTAIFQFAGEKVPDTKEVKKVLDG